VAATLSTPTRRDDYIEYTLDTPALATQLGAALDDECVLWDTSVIPTVQYYIKDAPAEELDADYLWRTAEFLDALLAQSTPSVRPILLPAMVDEARGMLGHTMRKAKARSKDPDVDRAVAYTLTRIAQTCGQLEKQWVKVGRQHPGPSGKLYDTLVKFVFAVDKRHHLTKRAQGVESKRRDTDWELAAAVAYYALTEKCPVRIYTRDQDVRKLVATPMSYLVGEFEFTTPVSVWKFAWETERFTNSVVGDPGVLIGWQLVDVDEDRALKSVQQASGPIAKLIDQIGGLVPA
jgi:hypothetical protein